MREKQLVLLIDDDIDMVEVMKIVLESSGYSVSSAYDPETGFVKAKTEKPDAIVLDVMFGAAEKVRGFDTAVRIRKDKEIASIPILMITSVNEKIPGMGFSSETDGEYMPVDGFINKPAQPEELIKTIKELLEKKTSKWVNWAS